MTGPRKTSSVDTPCIQPPANDDRLPSNFVERYQKLWVLALPVLVLLCGASLRIWVAEDAFITFRSVENLWHGYGPVYNKGIRVESFSHPLWFLMLSVARVFGAAYLGPLSALLGIACSVMGLALTARAGQLRSETGLRLFPLGALAIACLPPFWDFASSGLETGMTFLWIGWCSLRLSRSAPTRTGRLFTAMLIGLGPLIRPDLVVLAGCLLIAFLFSSRVTTERRVHLTLVALLPATVWQVFRMGYYAALVPTTFIAKESFHSVWWRGYLYLEDFFQTYNPEWILFLGACALLLRGVGGRKDTEARRHGLALAALCIGGVAHIVTVWRVGGDFMHARLLLPGFFAVFSSFAVVSLPCSRVLRASMAAGALIWCGWVAMCARTPYGLNLSSTGIANERLWHTLRAGVKRPLTAAGYRNHFFVDVAKNLRHKTEAEGYRAVFVPNIGVPTAELSLDTVVIDSLGLNDYIGARLLVPWHGRAGHEKAVPSAWFLARYPTPQGYISPIQGSRISLSVPTEEGIAAVRRVLESPQVVELKAAVTAPMTISRFLNNISLAWRLTSLRIPRDPEVAHEGTARSAAINIQGGRTPS